MIKLMKKTLLAAAIAGLSSTAVQAKKQDTDIKQVRNEAGIMLNILQTSLRQKGSDKNVSFKPKAVFYLAGQGVVFEIDSGRHGRSFFGFDFSGMLENLPVAPAAPFGNARQFVDEHEIEEIVREFVDHGNEQERDLRDKMRELSQEQRELSWQQREYNRSIRDLEFEKRNAESQRRKDIEMRIAELNKDIAKLEVKSKELEAFKSELTAERKKELKKRQELKQKLYKESLALFEDTIGDVLCRYGAGLSGLADNENVSFLLSDFVEAENDSNIKSHDKVYVFKHKDIQTCVAGKTNQNQLLSAATTYMF
ncbi:hypothetical protein [Paraglaciecola aestuariivivens]